MNTSKKQKKIAYLTNYAYQIDFPAPVAITTKQSRPFNSWYTTSRWYGRREEKPKYFCDGNKIQIRNLSCMFQEIVIMRRGLLLTLTTTSMGDDEVPVPPTLQNINADFITKEGRYSSPRREEGRDS